MRPAIEAPSRATRIRLHPTFEDRHLRKWLETPAKLLNEKAERLTRISPRRRTDVFRVTLPERPGQPLIVKRYRAGFWYSLKDLFRSSRAQRAYRLAEQLQRAGIRIAAPVAAVDCRRWRWLCECYFLALEERHAEGLRAIRGREQSPGCARTLIRTFATLIARLHNSGFQHSDITLSNFLVTYDVRNQPQFIVIDLDSLRPKWLLTKRAVVEDLTTLFRRVPMPVRERCWFLAEYSRQRSVRIQARDLARRLGGFTPLKPDGELRQ